MSEFGLERCYACTFTNFCYASWKHLKTFTTDLQEAVYHNPKWPKKTRLCACIPWHLHKQSPATTLVLYTAFRTLFSFTSIRCAHQKKCMKYTCSSSAVGMLTSYHICAFAWLLSSTNSKNNVPSRNVTGSFLKKKRDERAPEFGCISSYMYGRPEILKNLSNLFISEPTKCQVLTFQELRLLQCRLPPQNFGFLSPCYLSCSWNCLWLNPQ